MCFAPQRRALFQHLNCQKWSDNGVFCTFWLANVLRATTACNFSSLIWPAGSAPAALASLLFDPREPQIIWKTQCFATFLPFHASASSFFLLFLFYSSFFLIFLFSLPLPCSAFHLSILSEVWLLHFLRIGNHLIKIIRKSWVILGLVDSWGLPPVPISRLPTDKGQVGWERRASAKR